jgi:hypothetical protein
MDIGGLDFSDPRWSRLHGGYRRPYDPRAALMSLESGSDTEGAWKELWNELHHQGDVGDASYAAVPHLVRIHASCGIPQVDTYLMLAVIDNARRSSGNPEVPPELADAYHAAWDRMLDIGLRELASATDPNLVSSIIAVIAMAKRQPVLGELAFNFSEDERKQILSSFWR